MLVKPPMPISLLFTSYASIPFFTNGIEKRNYLQERKSKSEYSATINFIENKAA